MNLGVPVEGAADVRKENAYLGKVITMICYY